MRTGYGSIGPPDDNGETEFLIEGGAYIRNMNYVVRSWMWLLLLYNTFDL